jgi:1-aminocyclopropane-1-carboxylate deaminase
LEEVTGFSTEPPVREVEASWLAGHAVSVAMLRLDLLDPDINGNKYFKLLPNLAAAREAGYRKLLSFGGPWSNHLHALAAAGHRFGFETIGVVRGEATAEPTPCLADAMQWGMHLHHVSRQDYRLRHDAGYLLTLQQRFGSCYIIPEGGANGTGITGCQFIVSPQLASRFSHVLVACGTGSTLCGLITSTTLPVTGIQVLKGAGYLQRDVNSMLARYGLQAKSAHWEIRDEFHRGGYARVDAELLAFIAGFTEETGIPIEPVYSGKVMLALKTLLGSGYYPAGSRVLVIHGGGLQGLRGYRDQLSTGS